MPASEKKPKRQRPQCAHGERPIQVNGCAKCAMLAMGGLNLLRMCNVTAEELLTILRAAIPSRIEWDRRVAEARKQVAEAKDAAIATATGGA